MDVCDMWSKCGERVVLSINSHLQYCCLSQEKTKKEKKKKQSASVVYNCSILPHNLPST